MAIISVPKPAVSTGGVSDLAPMSARLDGTVNPQGFPATAYFQFGTDISNLNVVAALPATITGSSDVGMHASIGGLVPGQIYFYRLVASNTSFTVPGDYHSFFTPINPSAIRGSASSITSTSAVVSGVVNARGAATTSVFEYSTDGINFPVSITASPSPVDGTTDTPVSATLTGLNPQTTYYFRLRATNAGGESTSAAGTFTTLAAPIVTDPAASDVGSSTVTLSGTVNGQGLDTTVTFEWGTSLDALNLFATGTPGVVSGNQPQTVTAHLAGFQPETGYFFRLRAVNAAGQTVSSAVNFIMAGSAGAVTGAAEPTLESTKLTGTFNGRGQPTAVAFDYGTDQLLLDHSVAAGAGTISGADDVVLSATVPGLTPGQRYYFRAKSSNGGGTTVAKNVVSFDVPVNEPPVAVRDVFFYAGQVVVDPLENDSDANNKDPVPKNAGLVLAQDLVVPPSASADAAVVTADGRFISYNPQFNVLGEDSLTYRVADPQGATADAQVRFVSFAKRAGLYGGKITFGSGDAKREGQLSMLLGSGGAITTSIMNWPTGADRHSASFVLKGIFDQRGRFTRTLKDTLGGVTTTLAVTLVLDEALAKITGKFEEAVNGVSTTGIIDFTLSLNTGTGGLAASGLRTGFIELSPGVTGSMGDGFVRVAIGKDSRRSARFTGRMPDGEPFSAGVTASGRSYSLSKALEQGGVIAGLVRMVDDAAGRNGMMGSLVWKKRASSRARFERGGVNENFAIVGMAYPALDRRALPPIGLATQASNARLSFRGGNLTKTYRDVLFTILPGQMVVVGPDPAQSGDLIAVNQRDLKIDAEQGRFTGTFVHPETGDTVSFEGVFRVPFDSGVGEGRGVFRGSSQAGSVRIEVN